MGKPLYILETKLDTKKMMVKICVFVCHIMEEFTILETCKEGAISF